VTSVVIAAHNEEAGIGHCLDALLAQAGPDGLDIVVVANGCTDNTAAVARSRPGVRVLELAQAGKAAALNAGDESASGFPRVYLDADTVLPPGTLAALTEALAGPGEDGVTPLAVVPRRALDVTGRPLLIRAFYAINSRLPAYHHALFGRGVIALSQAGRERFDRFPELVADDLFLDSRFSVAEKREVPTASAPVATPRRTRDLVRRLTRLRTGNRALRKARPGLAEPGPAEPGLAGPGIRAAKHSSWLRDVVLPRPWLIPAGACYAAIIFAAELAARRGAGHGDWAPGEAVPR
jgi:glycosyltransferase involved in cell wall biosynthesis